MTHVIGSGPAGVAAASALLNRGEPVTMLDAGRQLEPDRRRLVDQLQRQPKTDWDPQHLATLRQGMASTSKGIPLKYVYGSDYPYRGVDAFVPLDKQPGVETAASFARGGFSNVWGSAVLPFRQADIADWPVSADDLAPHYRAVFDFVPLSARADDLAELFPLYGTPDPLKPSAQAAALLSDLDRSRQPLRDAGIHFGAARVAARASPKADRPGCVYCGLCMYGCPHELIYSSAHTLDRLLKHPNFTYVPNVVVRRLTESADHVTLDATNPQTQEPRTFTAARVLLACGVVATTRLLLESTQAYDHPVTCYDSQYYLFPLIRYRKPAASARAEELHTLAQLFFELTDPDLGPHTVHLQAYTYNDLYLAALKQMCRGTYPLLRAPVHALVERMIVLQGYLHSDLSPRITMTLDRPAADGSPGTLHLRQTPAPVDSVAIIKKVVKKFMRHRRHLRAIPAAPMLQIAPSGRGFHSGGTFPMSRAPTTDFQSDPLGRPTGFHRVHAVDATVLPSIPATTITLTVMANAHRIASELIIG